MKPCLQAFVLVGAIIAHREFFVGSSAPALLARLLKVFLAGGGVHPQPASEEV